MIENAMSGIIVGGALFYGALLLIYGGGLCLALLVLTGILKLMEKGRKI